MVFRPVCIGEGTGTFAWKRFKLGDPSGGYKETPTGVALGGSFTVEQETGTDWCYYIGKYEVSEAQLFALDLAPPGQEESAYPVRDISYFNAEEFIHKYNQWLYDTAQASVPTYGGIPGYLRLPTEQEWEFAARGGGAIEAALFDRKIPYPKDKLPEYEWFAGPSSSHNKIKQIGKLKPNTLGVHDMLGNVSEMTMTLYQVEYYQGRTGGFVAKGGHYLTDARQIRSSLRTEQEFYALDRKTKNFAPSKKNTLGFRLVLSSLVFPNRQVSKQLSNDWESYRNQKARSLPAAVSTAPTSTKTKVSGDEALLYLQRLQETLKNSGSLSEPVQQQLDLLGTSLNDIQFIVQQAEEDTAFAFIKIGSEQAFQVTFWGKRLAKVDSLLTPEAKAMLSKANNAALEKKRTEILQNFNQAVASYVDSIQAVAANSESARKVGYEKYQTFLSQKPNSKNQLLLQPIIQKHMEEYAEKKRLDMDTWKQELMNWSANNAQ